MHVCVIPLQKDSDGNYTDRKLCMDFSDPNAATEPDKNGMHKAEKSRDIAGKFFLLKLI